VRPDCNFELMAIDTTRLQRACEEVLLEHLGPIALVIAPEVVQGAQFPPEMPDAMQLSAFAARLKKELPGDLPRDLIARKVVDLYNASK
jgi:hypothetical protein